MIYYERPDVEGPKLCNYSKVHLSSEGRKNLREVLTQSNGILGTVEKTRHLYMVGQTRIHIDRVLGLGNFMELEVLIHLTRIVNYVVHFICCNNIDVKFLKVVLGDCDDPAKGEEIVKKLMKDLGVPESSLLTGAYLDMIIKK